MNVLDVIFLSKLGQWIKRRWKCIPEKDNQITSWFLLSFAIMTTILAITAALGTPMGATIVSHLINIGKFIVINWLLFIIWIIVIGALFSFLYIPIPRLFLAGFTYTIIATTIVFMTSKSGTKFSMLIGALSGIGALFIGLFFIFIFHKNISRNMKLVFTISLFIFISFYTSLNKTNTPSKDIPAFSGQSTIENPAKFGNYDYSFFTYGSGTDLHRDTFGIHIDQRTQTVDASDFITRWSDKRKDFWGFNPSKLPINGRTWMPEGEGPFPIILMVHGNHTMEYFSTNGYDYLGELLASRGFIAISVDQDFINYSNAYGSPNRNYELRTWMLLQHIVELQQMNDMPDSYFFNKIDFQQVAFVGHSRGGQAALMAADYETFFADDERLTSIQDINVKGVVAIAPTDRTVDGKKANIHNTSYLLLHGARDADVSSFRDRPFYQATFDSNYDGFKSSLYIADANHTHFNSEWGSMDLSLPRGIFLNQGDTLAPEDQQQVAKVYLSAFFERIFHHETGYEQLFRDYRYGQDWLPDTTFVNAYEHSSYLPIKTFHANDDEEIYVDGFKSWEILNAKDRDGNHKKLHALQLEWDKEASYTIDTSDQDLSHVRNLVFSMANIDEEVESVPPKIEIELELTNGTSNTLSLDEFMPFPPVIETDFTRLGLFEDLFRDAKYENAWEPVFQTFEVPIALLDREMIKKVTMHFTSESGKILLREIGLW